MSRLVFKNINSFKVAGNQLTQDKTVVLNLSLDEQIFTNGMNGVRSLKE